MPHAPHARRARARRPARARLSGPGSTDRNMLPARLRAIEHRRVWHVAGPMILSNVSIALIGLVDAGVVGHLDAAYYLGAVAIAGVVFDFIYWGMGFLRMGTTGIVAQMHGSGDHERMRASLAQALAAGAVIAALILIGREAIIDLALTVLHGSAEVHRHARRYFDIAVWGAPAMMALFAFTGWFIGMQNARAPLVFMVTMNLVNVVLDLVLVVGLGYEVAGVAAASVAGQYAALAVAIVLVRRELRRYPGRWRRARVLDGGALRRMLSLNWNILLRTLALIFAFSFFTSQGARQGDVVLAANTVLLKFTLLLALGLDGFAHAAEALVGRAIGRGDARALRRAVFDTAAWSVLAACGYTLLFAAAGPWITSMLTDLAPVRAAVGHYLPWLVAAPLLCVWCFLLDGVFIGATRGAEMRNTMLVASFLVFLPAWWLLRPLGNHGLWLAFMLFFVARGLGLGLMYRRIERGAGFVRAT